MSKRAIAVVVSGFITVFVAYSIRYGFGMLLPEMVLDLNISKTQAGTISAVYFIVYTISTPILGVISDRYSYRTILTVFTAILGIGAVLMAWVSGYIDASFYYAIAAFGHAACWAPVMILVQKWAPENRRGTAVAFVGVGTCLGIFSWGLLLPVVVAVSGWRIGWMCLGLSGLLVALVNFFLIRNPHNHFEQSVTRKLDVIAFLGAYKCVFRLPVFWIVGIAYLCVGFNIITIFNFLPIHARESLGAAYSVSTRYISIVALAGIAGQLILGALSDRIGRFRTMITSAIFLGGASLGISQTSNIWTLGFFAACWGFGYGAVCAVYSAAASDLFSERYTGGVVGIWTAFLGLGSVIAPIISGRIIDNSGSYTWVFLSAMIAGLLSIVLLFTRHRNFSSP